jgi:hypothetical protein
MQITSRKCTRTSTNRFIDQTVHPRDGWYPSETNLNDIQPFQPPPDRDNSSHWTLAQPTKSGAQQFI